MKQYFLTVRMLWAREILRFFRQKSRIIGALGTPIIFWFLIGSGFGASFQAGVVSRNSELNYLSYFFPGSMLLIILFTAIFSTFSLIQDRQEGFLQGVLVAPVPRSAIVLGKVLGGASLAFFQSLLFLAALPFLGISISAQSFLILGLVIFMNAFAITALGFFAAWKINSIQGFHVVMNMILMPAWFLSGALFPQDNAPLWIRWVMQMNPLSYGLALMRRILNQGDGGLIGLPNYGFSFLVLIIFMFASFTGCVMIIRNRKTENMV